MVNSMPKLRDPNDSQKDHRFSEDDELVMNDIGFISHFSSNYFVPVIFFYYVYNCDIRRAHSKSLFHTQTSQEITTRSLRDEHNLSPFHPK